MRTRELTGDRDRNVLPIDTPVYFRLGTCLVGSSLLDEPVFSRATRQSCGSTVIAGVLRIEGVLF